MLYEQTPHDVLPQATHDELARQNFVQSLQVHLATQVFPGNKAAYEHRATPRFERERWRADYLDRILRVVREEQEAIARGKIPDSYEAAIQAVSS